MEVGVSVEVGVGVGAGVAVEAPVEVGLDDSLGVAGVTAVGFVSVGLEVEVGVEEVGVCVDTADGVVGAVLVLATSSSELTQPEIRTATTVSSVSKRSSKRPVGLRWGSMAAIFSHHT